MSSGSIGIIGNLPHIGASQANQANDTSLAGRCAAYAAPIIESVKAVTYMINGKLFTQVIDAISRGATATSGTAHQITELVKKLPYLKIFGGVVLPVAAYYIGKDIQKLASARDHEEKVDAGLSLATNSGWFSDATATFVSGMQLFGWVGSEATSVISGFLGFGALMAPATIFQAVRATKTSKRALEILRDTPEALNITLRNEPKYQTVKKALNISTACIKGKDEGWLDRILHGLTHFHGTGSAEGLRAVNKHLQCRITCNKVSIVSAILLTLGTALVLLTPWLMPAYGLLAAAAVLTAVSLGGEAYSCRKLCRKLDRLSVAESWPVGA